MSLFLIAVFLIALTVGNPDFLSDESKELTLRVHDECKSTHLILNFYLTSSQATDLMSLAPTSVPASLILFMRSKNAFEVHRQAALAS